MYLLLKSFLYIFQRDSSELIFLLHPPGSLTVDSKETVSLAVTPASSLLKMSSLVAYDNSDSEDDSSDQQEKRLSPAQTAPFEQNQSPNAPMLPDPPTSAMDQMVSGYHGDTLSNYHPQSQSLSQSDWRSFSRRQEKVVMDCTSPSMTHWNIPSVQTPPCIQKSFSLVSNSTKRLQNVPSDVRPYISKRRRLSTSVETEQKDDPSEPDHGSQSREAPILSNVPSKLAPYLGQKPRAAKIPRRLLMSLGGHKGPVNTVQWSPVPQFSHLLLSASMDKTFKVWDGAASGRCLRVYTCHSGAVRDACWTPCGQQLLTASFDNTAAITDVETGQQTVKLNNEFKVMCVALHPSNPSVVLCGGYSSAVKAWDSRSCKVMKVYKAGVQQTLDILFLRGGEDFITSSDCVSRDSADRTLIAWDYQTTAVLSNQIYNERYTCPSLALHPLEDTFVAQTNGNYMALFSTQRPYRMNKRRRFEGHKVSRWRDMPCSVSFPWTELSWSRAAPLAPLTSTTFTTLVCCTLCRPTASPACASLNILSCLPLPPPVTGQVRSRSGTDRLLRRKENEKGDCRTLKFN
ncbi:WD repeat-containing protein 25 isoform X2 [Oryzias latipes]